MVLTYHTSTAELHSAGLLSRRAVNELASIGITTMGELLQADDEGIDFSRMRKIGVKTLDEIVNTVGIARDSNVSPPLPELSLSQYYPDTVDRYATEAYRETLEMFAGPAADDFKAEFPDTARLSGMLVAGTDALHAVPAGLTMRRIQTRCRMLEHYYHGLSLRLGADETLRDTPLHEVCRTIASAAGEMGRELPYELLYRRVMTDTQRQRLMTEFDWMLYRASARAANILIQQTDALGTLIKLFRSPVSEYASLCPGHSMRKTISEIFELNAELRRSFDTIMSMDKRQITRMHVAETYPFLFSPSQRFVTTYINIYDSVPMFHLMEQYLRGSRLRNDRIYCLLKGVDDKSDATTRALAAKYGLTAERVRQLAESGPQMLSATWYTELDPKKLYPDLLALPYISTATRSPLGRIREDEQLSVTTMGLLRLFSLLSGYPLFEFEGFAVVVNRDVIGDFDIKHFSDNLQAIVSDRRSDDRTMDMRFFMRLHKIRTTRLTVELARHIAIHAFGCRPAEGEHVRLRRTCVDVSIECYRILRDNGNVMHISDIFREFKNRFPTHKFTDPNQLRRLLWSHPQIRPVGKQSTYGLAEWSHVYYGSMRDLLIECISASDSPVPLDELLEYVRRHYPEATATNLYSTMTSDTMGRFKQYADGFGLSNVSYHGATEKVLRRSRLEFDERLADFMAFIEREGHYPQRDSENSQAETSLYSWRANILSGRLRIDPLQRREFDLTMESIDPSVPRTRTEMMFRHRTDTVAAALAEGRAVDNLDATLRRWLRSALRTTRPYGDSRDICLARLRDLVSI